RRQNTVRTGITLVLGLVALADCFGQPIITTQPKSQAVPVGANASFGVEASAGVPPYRFQWRLNQIDLAGQTNKSLALTHVGLADAGTYTVAVTDTFEDMVTSEPANLVIDSGFTRVTTGEIVTDAAHSFGCAWGDYDNDGYLDLIVGNGLGD